MKGKFMITSRHLCGTFSKVLSLSEEFLKIDPREWHLATPRIAAYETDRLHLCESGEQFCRAEMSQSGRRRLSQQRHLAKSDATTLTIWRSRMQPQTLTLTVTWDMTFTHTLTLTLKNILTQNLTLTQILTLT